MKSIYETFVHVCLFGTALVLSGIANATTYTGAQLNLSPSGNVYINNGIYLIFQTDGSLVVYNSGTYATLWSVGGGQSCSSGCNATFKTNGDLVVAKGSTTIWESGTSGNTGATLVTSATAPYLTIKNSAGTAIWNSTSGKLNVTTTISYAGGALNLSPGGSSYIGNNEYLIFGTDGSFSVYNSATYTTLFSIGGGQSCSSGCNATFNSTGNLVLDKGTTAFWRSGTAVNSGAVLYASTAAPYLVIKSSSGTVLWSSNNPNPPPTPSPTPAPVPAPVPAPAPAPASIAVSATASTVVPMQSDASVSGMSADNTGLSFDWGYVTGGGYVTYNLSVATAGVYQIVLNYASPTGGTGANVIVNGALGASVSFGSTGSWSTYANASSALINLPMGSATLEIQAQSAANFNLGGITLSPTPAPSPSPAPAPAPAPTPSPGGIPTDAGGTQASRIADLLERFGINVYPMTSYPGSNVFGSSGNYTTTSIDHAVGWLTANSSGSAFGSGLNMGLRLWDYQAQTGQIDLSTIGAQIAQATGVHYTVVPGGAPGSGDSIPYSIALGNYSHNGTNGWTGVALHSVTNLEGYNEPNGIGGETASQATAGQQELYAGINFPEITRSCPSTVFGLPVPEGYISGYLGSNQSTIAANCDLWTVHFYPSQNPDFDDTSGRGGEFNDVYQGINFAYGATKGQIITEWHPTEYLSNTSAIYNPTYDGYYTPMFMLSAFRLGYLGYYWWAMYDFNSSYSGNGLWPTDSLTDTPRNAAYVIRAMYALTGDSNAAQKHSFSPGKLNYSVSGAPAPASGSPNSGGQTMLFQNSSGTYFLFVWNSQETPGGASVPVTVNFGEAHASITDYDLTDNPSGNMTAVKSASNASSLTISLDAAVHLLVIHY